MIDFPPDPPHIRHAKASLAAAGIPLEAGLAALNLARACYLATPQVNRAELLRQECNRTQDELERVSAELLRERKTAQRLAQELIRLGALPVPKGVLKALLKRLRAVREVLLHGTWADAHKVATARDLLDQALVSLAAQEELRDEQGEPLVIVQIQRVPTKQTSSGAGPARLVGTQQQRLAELEALLGRRTRFEQQLDRLLTQLHGLITQPEDALWEAAGENEPLRRLLKTWRRLAGMLENLLEAKAQP